MKYYAVTEDPNELMHYGVKGMKWGVIRTDAQLGHFTKPRTAAYNRARSKLQSKRSDNIMQKGIKAVEAKWNTYNSPENKELRAYKKAVNKEARAAKRSEKLFQKHVQLARQGRLKYKGISDAEVERITDRLALERSARSLSGTEKPSFVRRLGESASAGIIQGVGQGMATRTSEWMGRKSKLKTARLTAEQSNRIREEQDRRDFAERERQEKIQFKREQKEQKAKDKYQDQLTVQRENAKRSRDLRNQYEDMAIEEGAKVQKHISDKTRRRLVSEMQDVRDERDYQKNLRKIGDEDRVRKNSLLEYTQKLNAANDKREQEKEAQSHALAQRREQERLNLVRQGLIAPTNDFDREQRDTFKRQQAQEAARLYSQQREALKASRAEEHKRLESERLAKEEAARKKESEWLTQQAVARRDWNAKTREQEAARQARKAAEDAYFERYRNGEPYRNNPLYGKHTAVGKYGTRTTSIVRNPIGNGTQFSPSSSVTRTSVATATQRERARRAKQTKKRTHVTI